ncbi:MAG: crotonase/enoyl-CoA hydratase family protein [Pseudomonadota bacterium]
MNFQSIRIDQDGRGVATLVLNLPEKHNAMSSAMIAELSEAAKILGDDPAVRVVVLTGEGKSFCAGGDLGWMRQQFDADRETRIAEAMKLASMLRDLNELPKPVIGRINGQAFGGGIGLISICDVAIGVEDAKFALTETKLGLIPATISPYVLARMGEGNARQVFMSGRRFTAKEAVNLALLAKSTPASELEAEVEAQIDAYLSTAPGAVAKAKALARALGPRIDERVMQDTAQRLAECWEAPEAQEGISAFFEKRKPTWQSDNR